MATPQTPLEALKATALAAVAYVGYANYAPRERAANKAIQQSFKTGKYVSPESCQE